MAGSSMRLVDQFYVLWRNKADLPVWSGPYDTFEAATHPPDKNYYVKKGLQG